MAAPQLRALLQAWLRGYIRPGYPQGRHSQVREFVLCRAVQRQQQGELVVAAAEANLALVTAMSVITPGQVSELHGKVMRSMSVGYDLIQLEPPSAIEASQPKSNLQGVEEMAALLKALKASNLKDMLPVT